MISNVLIGDAYVNIMRICTKDRSYAWFFFCLLEQVLPWHRFVKELDKIYELIINIELIKEPFKHKQNRYKNLRHNYNKMYFANLPLSQSACAGRPCLVDKACTDSSGSCRCYVVRVIAFWLQILIIINNIRLKRACTVVKKIV